ncbi:MAG: hypothetical protein DHS20C06_06360 [Hyphobacterium sp.]|nr:MAG: hypothetical protein DHS20C06_06360 [Hyphobacterium sp.]
MRRHFDEVESGFNGRFNSGIGGHDSLLLAMLIDEQDTGNANILINAGALFFGGRRGKGSACYVTSPLIARNEKIPQMREKATVNGQSAHPHCSGRVL